MIRSYPVRVVEHTYGGFPLKVHLGDPLAQGWYDNDWPELPEIAELRQSKLIPGARVFDIGAHQGVVALMLARVVTESGLVVAVEASPHNSRIVQQNQRLNSVKQIEVVPCAISDRPGELTFSEGLNGQIDDGTGTWGQITVPAITIDGLIDRFGLADVVFLDVEGAESMALSGGPKALASGADFFVEVHVGCGIEKLGSSVAQILSYFPEDRFRLLARTEADEAFRPLQKDDPVTQQRFFLLALSKAKPN